MNELQVQALCLSDDFFQCYCVIMLESPIHILRLFIAVTASFIRIFLEGVHKEQQAKIHPVSLLQI